MRLTFLRVFALGLFWIWDPWPAYLANFLADALDCPVDYLKITVQNLKPFPKEVRCDTGWSYQVTDKVLDWIMNSVALIALYFEKKTRYFKLLLSLHLYRTVGMIGYFWTRHRYFFLIFPNFFDLMFLYLVGAEYFEQSANEAGFLSIVLLKLMLERKLHQKND